MARQQIPGLRFSANFESGNIGKGTSMNNVAPGAPVNGGRQVPGTRGAV